MLVFKKKYFLIIENIKDIDLRNIKKRNKFAIIYRNSVKNKQSFELKSFRKKCKSKSIAFFVANNIDLAKDLKADGIYLSAHNLDFKSLNLKRRNFSIVGSAHNIREISNKTKQGCDYILFSRLFKVSYKPQKDYLGVLKFNNLVRNTFKKLIPLGGINLSNLGNLNNVSSDYFAIMSELKKKPAQIFSRLF